MKVMVIDMNLGNPRLLRQALAAVALAAIVLTTSGCAVLQSSSDAQRRNNLVIVPPDAGPVDSVRWDDIRHLRPLNQRMILMEVDRRPHLLVLAQQCRGLNRNSMFVFDRRTPRFSPRRDAIGVVSPGVGGMTSTCFPDTLYAIRDEDVDHLRASL